MYAWKLSIFFIYYVVVVFQIKTGTIIGIYVNMGKYKYFIFYCSTGRTEQFFISKFFYCSQDTWFGPEKLQTFRFLKPSNHCISKDKIFSFEPVQLEPSIHFASPSLNSTIDITILNVQAVTLFLCVDIFERAWYFAFNRHVSFIYLSRRPSLYYVSKGTGWVRSEKWQFLLTCLVLFMLTWGGWVRNSPKMCWSNIGMVSS